MLNPEKRAGLSQILFSPWYSWKIVDLALNRNPSLKLQNTVNTTGYQYVVIHKTQVTFQTQKNVGLDLWIGNKYVCIRMVTG